MDFSSPAFWIAVGQIILIDVLLGGDNAVIIALAVRKLEPAKRRLGILWGTLGAIGLRVILIFFALALLQIPLLKMVGGLLLLWIGIKLLIPDHDEGHEGIASSDQLWIAVRTVIVADLVMSIDNVIAIAGAAQGAGAGNELPLVIFGLVVSVPIIIWGSQIVVKLMDRFPVVITLGGMLLGWIAGGMMVTDPLVVQYVAPYMPQAKWAAEVGGALLVLVVGMMAGRRKKKPHTSH